MKKIKTKKVLEELFIWFSVLVIFYLIAWILIVGYSAIQAWRKVHQPRNPITNVQEETDEEISARICSLDSVVCEGESSDDNSYLAVITAYSALESCHYPRCIMSSGKPAYIKAAACPRVYNLGQKIEIEGLGEFICEDRTALIYNGRFDIFMGYDKEAYNKAINFGKQVRKVIIK